MKTSILLFLVMILAACGSSNDDETPVLPTRFEGDQVTTEAIDNPSQTPTIEIPTATSAPIIRPTLPPTWTPTSAPTETPTQVRSPTSTPFIPPPSTGNDPNQSESCLNYRVDFEASTEEFRLGTSPTIAWTPVDGVGLYRVYVIDEFENQLFFELTTETTLQIPAETFTELGTYGWSVEPLDPVGIQMCTARGSEFTATR